MVNRRYRKGYEYERKLVNKERDKGNVSFRSAGSHSPIDVISIDHRNKRIELVQAKAGESYTDSKKAKIQAENSYLEGKYDVVFICK